MVEPRSSHLKPKHLAGENTNVLAKRFTFRSISVYFITGTLKNPNTRFRRFL